MITGVEGCTTAYGIGYASTYSQGRLPEGVNSYPSATLGELDADERSDSIEYLDSGWADGERCNV